jgi:hypothetical protein
MKVYVAFCGDHEHELVGVFRDAGDALKASQEANKEWYPEKDYGEKWFSVSYYEEMELQ